MFFSDIAALGSHVVESRGGEGFIQINLSSTVTSFEFIRAKGDKRKKNYKNKN